MKWLSVCSFFTRSLALSIFSSVKQMPSVADDISINYLSMFFGKIIKMRYSSMGLMYYRLRAMLYIMHTAYIKLEHFFRNKEKTKFQPKLYTVVLVNCLAYISE